MEVKRYLEILHTFEKLKHVTRHCYMQGGRQESVAEHSHRLAVMAYFVKDEFPKVDIDKVIKMCLFHDLGEAFTGDIPAFHKTDEHEKTETKKIDDYLNALPEPYQKELEDLFQEMRALKTEEAKLYKALDQMEAVIQHNESDISTWLPLEYDLQLVYGAEYVAFSPYMTALKEECNQITKKKIEEAKNEAK